MEALIIFERLGDLFAIACSKTDLGNALRRRRRFSEAVKYVQEARDLMENRILLGDQTEVEEYQLGYARCLNVIGLIHFGLGSEDDLKVAIELCEKSKQIKERFGDIEGTAESENALGLILGEQGRILSTKNEVGAVSKLNGSILHLQKAIASRQKTGNNRGCFQHCRNLGLAHSRLVNLTKDSVKKEQYVRLTKKDYQDGMSYLNKTRPEPPPGEVLECKFRLGELSVQLGEYGEAIRWLEPVEKQRRELRDWHNRARTLDLLREAYTDMEKKKGTCIDILSIYRDVLISKAKVQEMKDATIKLTNAKDILQKTANSLKEMGLLELSDEALEIREELIKADC